MKVKILKDTPFDKAGTVLSIDEFRLKYQYICTKEVTNVELFEYLKIFKFNPIGELDVWFDPVVPFPNTSDYILDAIIEGVLYSKQIDGYYHKFLLGSTIEAENSLGCITSEQFSELIKTSKFKKPTLYCTDNINKKL